MCVSFMFSFGAVSASLEVHLSSFGMHYAYISLCFVLSEGTYLFCSLFMGYYVKISDERIFMALGAFFQSTAYLMFGPWEVIFPNEVYIVILSLPVFTLGQVMIYCIL